ncbi:MAG: hypothetical protein AAFX50_02865 [Acidobacteriota bacterium]
MENKNLEDGMARLLMEIDAEDALGEETPGELEMLEGLSFGTASADDAESLRTRARDDADAARLLAAYGPLGGDAKSRLMAGVQAELAASSRGPRRMLPQSRRTDDPSAGRRAGAPARPAVENRSANDNARRAGRREGVEGVESPDDGQADAPADPAGAVVPITRGRPARRRWLPQAVAAVAAVLLCVVLWPRPQDPLPAYQMSAESTTRKMRSVPTAPAPRPDTGVDVLTLAPEESFEIVLRPASAVDGAVAAVYALRGSGLERLALPVDISDNGSVRVRGRFDAALRGSSDAVELRVVISGGDSLPGPAELASSAADGGDGDAKWRVFGVTLEAEPEGVL